MLEDLPTGDFYFHKATDDRGRLNITFHKTLSSFEKSVVEGCRFCTFVSQGLRRNKVQWYPDLGAHFRIKHNEGLGIYFMHLKLGKGKPEFDNPDFFVDLTKKSTAEGGSE